LRRVGARQGFEVVAHPGITVVPPGALMITGSGTPYQVHTLLSPLDRGDVASAGSGTEATLVAGTHRPGVHADVGGTHQRGAVTRAAGGR
jgi:hypothetical protein